MSTVCARVRAAGFCGLMAFLPVLAKAEDPADRWLFPHDAVRGYIGVEVAPPHNEIDAGLCPVGVRSYKPLNCTAFARYQWTGYIELQPFGHALRRVFFFMRPTLLGGSNMPQEEYTASAEPILWERTQGMGVQLPKSFELRITQHKTGLFGRYRNMPIRPDGPYGLYTTVGVRWYFGSWRSGLIRAE